MATFKDALKQYPELADYEPNVLITLLVQLKGSDGKPEPHIRLGMTYSCKQCQPMFERALAKLPSWVLVELNRGPGPDKPIVGFAS